MAATTYRLCEDETSWGTQIRVLDDKGHERFKVEISPSHFEAEYKVNWQALGSVSADLTQHVASALQSAANLAQRKNEGLR